MNQGFKETKTFLLCLIFCSFLVLGQFPLPTLFKSNVHFELKLQLQIQQSGAIIMYFSPEVTWVSMPTNVVNFSFWLILFVFRTIFYQLHSKFLLTEGETNSITDLHYYNVECIFRHHILSDNIVCDTHSAVISISIYLKNI